VDRPALHAVEQFVHAGYPLDVEALLIVEVDGPRAEVDHLIARVEAIATSCHAATCRVSNSEEERLLFWAGRKAAFPAVGRISPDYYCMDGTIPRARLPQVLKRMRELSEQYGLAVANVFHAGDGNLHPLILYDANKPGELERTEAFGADILRLCVEVGGQWAVAEGKALDLVGQGSKRALGRPAQTDVTLDLSRLSGVTLYEPEELVLSAKAGTPLAEIEALVAAKGQQLAFEPMDFEPILGGAAGRGTIGGALAANLSGPRRIKAGAARDHFLGFTAVSGRGETFKS